MSEPAFLADLPLARAAHAFAAERHAGQTRRPDGAPFIRHPEEVAALLHDAGFSEPVVAAGLLHDVLEKTDTTVEELERRFGPEVARLVEAVSEDDRIDSYADRKAALIDSAVGAGPDGAALLAADWTRPSWWPPRGPVVPSRIADSASVIVDPADAPACAVPPAPPGGPACPGPAAAPDCATLAESFS